MGSFLSISLIAVLSYINIPDYPKYDSELIILLEGKYLERNIFLQNALCSNGVGFCTYDIRVNGDLVTDNIQSSAFEIDLQNFDLIFGEDVIVEIRHRKGCVPKILNERALCPNPTFELVDISITDQGILNWTTKNENGSLPFIIQQYRWNKWNNIGEIKGKGVPELCDYNFNVDFNSGQNKFRILQLDNKGKPRLSKNITHNSSIPKLTFFYNRQKKQIVFSAKTKFEIHDKYGTLIQRGYNELIEVENLPKDYYWLSYDSVTEKFKRN